MSNIAIIGITADPPTVGHAWLANTAKATGFFEAVWLLPCYQHRLGKNPVASEHRLAMTHLLAKDIDVSVCDYEIVSHSIGACWQTHKSLTNFYQRDFTWVIGLDNAIEIDKWERSDQLKSGAVPFLVCARGGIEYPVGHHWFDNSPHRYIETKSCIECSSKKFKEFYKADNQRCREMVTPSVFAYIQKEGLYS